MGFGRNPHVAKAEAAEQKAETATDPKFATAAWLEAARLWERAADRETEPKRRLEYEENAERTRKSAEEVTEPPAIDLSDLLP